MTPHQFRQPVIQFRPDFQRHDCLQRRTGQFQRQVALARGAGIHNRAIALSGSQEESGHALQWTLGGRHADSPQGPAGKHFQALKAEREMGSPFAPCQRVQFVQNHCSCLRKQPPAAIRREQQVQRLRRGYQNVRRLIQQPAAVGRGTVPGAQTGGNARSRQASGLEAPVDPRKRLAQVPANVVREGPQRRNVNDFRSLRQISPQAAA